MGLRVFLGILGFFVGFVFTVYHWSRQWGVDAEAVLGASLGAGALLCLGCLLFLAAWGPRGKKPRRIGGFTMMPVSFFFPFAVSTVGLRAALWFLA